MYILDFGVIFTIMIQIRLQRRGKKNDPSFRVIVVDSKKKPKTGNYLEMVGSYDPRVDRIDLKPERILAWIANGAQVSDTVHNILVSQKVIDAKKKNVLPKKTAPVKEVPAAAPVAVAPTPAAVVDEVATPAEEEAPAVAEEVAVETEVAKEEDNSVADVTTTA